jgi:hypothetical protein
MDHAKGPSGIALSFDGSITSLSVALVAGGPMAHLVYHAQVNELHVGLSSRVDQFKVPCLQSHLRTRAALLMSFHFVSSPPRPRYLWARSR